MIIGLLKKGWWTCAICIWSNLRSWWKSLISVIVLQLWDCRKRMHAVLKIHKNYILVDSTINLHLSVELSFWNCMNWKDMIKKTYKVMNQLGLFMPFEVNLMHALNMINYSNLWLWVFTALIGANAIKYGNGNEVVAFCRKLAIAVEL